MSKAITPPVVDELYIDDPADFTDVPQVGPVYQERLNDAGFYTWDDLEDACVHEIMLVEGMGLTRIYRLNERLDNEFRAAGLPPSCGGPAPCAPSRGGCPNLGGES